MNYVKKKFILIIFIPSFFACSVKKENSFNYKVSVQHLANNIWQIHYDFPFPIYGVEFNRRNNQFRHNNWQVLSNNLKIEKIHGREVLFSKNGTLFKEAKIILKSYYKHLTKEYDFFQAFTDGSVVMYTGHYNVSLLIYKQNETKTKENLILDKSKLTVSNFEFYSRNNEQIIVLGKSFKNFAKWTSSKKGTYVYFGNIETIKTPFLLAIIDPGLPKWILRKTRAFLPQLFDFYTKKTKTKLNFRPVVFFNFINNNSKSANYGGGTLPGLIQLTIEGTNWKKENKVNIQHIDKLLAHETTHLWNGQMYNFDNKHGESWIHEGGAEAFAYRALYHFNIINYKELQSKYKNDFNKCIVGLKNYALNDSAKYRNFKNYYYCGSTLALITELALKKVDKNLDIFDFWQRLFVNAKSKNNAYYNQNLYLETMKEFNIDNYIIRSMEEITIKKQKNIFNKFKDIFSKLNVTLGKFLINKK